MADVEACHSSLLEFIKKPMVDTEKPKPVDQLLRSICYLSFQPIKVEVDEKSEKISVEKLIAKYESSFDWEQKVKEYIGDNKDYWIKYISDRNQKQ